MITDEELYHKSKEYSKLAWIDNAEDVESRRYISAYDYRQGYKQALEDLKNDHFVNMDAEEQHITVVNQAREHNQWLREHPEYVQEPETDHRQSEATC